MPDPVIIDLDFTQLDSSTSASNLHFYFKDNSFMMYTLPGTSLTIEIDEQHLKADWSQLLSLYKKIISESHKSSGFMFFNPVEVTDDDIAIQTFLNTGNILVDLNKCKLIKTVKSKRKVVKLINLMDWDDKTPYYFFNIDYPHLSREELNSLIDWAHSPDHALKMCI